MVFILLRLFPLFREANIRDFFLAVPAKVEIHNPPQELIAFYRTATSTANSLPCGGVAWFMGAEGTTAPAIGVERS